MAKINFIAGFFKYSSATEQKEKLLFEAGKRLRTALGNASDNVIIERFFVQTNLRHPYDLHGRRRCRVALEFYKVKINI